MGNISDISGSVNVAGGDITTYHTVTGLSAAEIKQLFDGLYTVIESNKKVSPTKKEDLKAEVKEIQTTVTEATQNNEKVDEGFLSRRFRNIARMAPDVLDFVVAMLANPLAGLGVGSRRSQRRRRKRRRADQGDLRSQVGGVADPRRAKRMSAGKAIAELIFHDISDTNVS